MGGDSHHLSNSGGASSPAPTCGECPPQARRLGYVPREVSIGWRRPTPLWSTLPRGHKGDRPGREDTSNLLSTLQDPVATQALVRGRRGRTSGPLLAAPPDDCILTISPLFTRRSYTQSHDRMLGLPVEHFFLSASQDCRILSAFSRSYERNPTKGISVLQADWTPRGMGGRCERRLEDLRTLRRSKIELCVARRSSRKASPYKRCLRRCLPCCSAGHLTRKALP